MTNRKTTLVASSLTLAAAALTSIAFTSSALAQCSECAVYPDRDPFTRGLLVTPTPAAAASPKRVVTHRVANDAHAEMRGNRVRHAANSDHVNR